MVLSVIGSEERDLAGALPRWRPASLAPCLAGASTSYGSYWQSMIWASEILFERPGRTGFPPESAPIRPRVVPLDDLPLTSNSPDLDNLPLRSISLDSDNLPLTWTAAMTWAVALPLTSSPCFDNLPLTSTHGLDSPVNKEVIAVTLILPIHISRLVLLLTLATDADIISAIACAYNKTLSGPLLI